MTHKNIMYLTVLAAGLTTAWGCPCETVKTATPRAHVERPPFLIKPCNDRPHVQESPAEQQQNLARNQALLETLQHAARRCSGMAWRVCLVKDGQEVAWERFYPFTPEETEGARAAFLDHARAVKTDTSVQPCGTTGKVFLSLWFLDAEGNLIAGVEASSLGMDCDITPDGYLYNAAISLPDQDLRFLEHAGDAAQRDADIRAFFATTPKGR